MRSENGSVPTLTVIVATRDRPAQLMACLTSLERQRRTFPAFDTIVVDDGSADAAAVAQAVAPYPWAHLLRGNHGGVSSARNLGVEAARAPFLAFIDDDCVTGPGWAQRLVRALQNGADAVAGPTVVGRRDDRLAGASQVVANALVTREAARLEHTDFAPSSNLACRRDVFRNQPFSLLYADAAAEDRDWCERLVRSGRGLAYDPGAIVYHFQELDLSTFLTKHFRYGRGAFEYRRRHRRGRLERPGFYGKLVVEGFQAGFGTGVCVCVAQLATAAGFVAGTLAARSR
ncbi:MAG: hypothetical protein QOE36_3440 [Gaiellaceae bacterium]|nr:hypothetical protein [Gaiellaceae bacterium]